MTDTPAIPFARQIAAVRREIAMRKNVYPKWVLLGKMRQGESGMPPCSTP
jgi:hypothetical protein